MRSRALVTALLALAVLAAWVNGLLVRWFQVEFRLGDTADRGDYLVAAGACLATALLLLVAMVAMFVLAPPRWLLVATALGVGTQLALSITSYYRSQSLDDNAASGTFGHGFIEALVRPGSWPLLAVLVATVVVGTRRLTAGRRSSDRGPAL